VLGGAVVEDQPVVTLRLVRISGGREGALVEAAVHKGIKEVVLSTGLTEQVLAVTTFRA
jgi:hypothetical protein